MKKRYQGRKSDGKMMTIRSARWQKLIKYRGLDEESMWRVEESYEA